MADVTVPRLTARPAVSLQHNSSSARKCHTPKANGAGRTHPPTWPGAKDFGNVPLETCHLLYAVTPTPFKTVSTFSSATSRPPSTFRISTIPIPSWNVPCGEAPYGNGLTFPVLT